MAGFSMGGGQPPRIGKSAGGTIKRAKPQMAFGESSVADAVAAKFKGKKMDKPKGTIGLVQPPKRYKL